MTGRERCSRRDVREQGIRPDSGDGSLGGLNVNFWILQFGAIVRIRLDGIELNAPTFSVDVDQLERAFRALDSSLHDAQKDLGYSNYVVTVGIHGRVEGTESKAFLARFTGDVPPGLGDIVGSGAVFYFEGRPPATLLSVSADLSEWSVLDHEIAEQIGLADAEGQAITLLHKDGSTDGKLVRTTMTMIADEGAALDVDATVFVAGHQSGGYGRSRKTPNEKIALNAAGFVKQGAWIMK